MYVFSHNVPDEIVLAYSDDCARARIAHAFISTRDVVGLEDSLEDSRDKVHPMFLECDDNVCGCEGGDMLEPDYDDLLEGHMFLTPYMTR